MTMTMIQNWRRRKVCMRCYPFAGGNEVAASLANGALLAAQLATGRDPSAQEIAELASPRSRQPSSPPNSVGASSLGLSLGNGTPFTSPTFPDHQNVKTYRSSDPTPNDLAQPGGLAPRLQERASTRSLGSTFEEQFARRMSLTSSSFDSSLSPQRHRAKTYDYFESTSFSLTSSALPLTPPFSLDAKTPGLPPLSPHSFSHHSSSQANHPLQSLSPSPPSSNQPRDIWSSRPAPRPKPIGTDWQPESDVGDAFDPTLGRSSSSSSSSPTKRKMPKPIGTKATPTFQHQAPFDQLPSADNTTTMTRSGYER